MNVVNLARAIVPRKLRAPLRNWVYARIPLDKRMGKEYWQWKGFLQEAQWWDRERIDVWQLGKLQAIVRHAYENVPGYHALYREAGVKPDDIVSLSDVRRLPFTTKELLRDNLQDFTARNVPSRQLRYVTTGGSTGIPLGFYRTSTTIRMENAFMHSGWQRVGWKLGDTSAVLRGTFVGSEEYFWDYNEGNRELVLSSYYLTNRTYPRYVAKIEEFHPMHLQAYPSVATLLADLILEQGDVGRIDFEVILLGSENICEWQKTKLRAAFPNARLFGFYGHAEQAVLAAWCEYSEQYHDWPFYGLTEILNENDEPIETGYVGEVVGTSFRKLGTLFVRYRTGDLARYGEIGCRHCGRQSLIIEDITGRIHHTLVLESGRKIPLANSWLMNVLSNVKQFQFYQDTPGRAKLRIAGNSSFSDQDSQSISRELFGLFGSELHCEIEFVDGIPRTRSGKHNNLVQKLNIR